VSCPAASRRGWRTSTGDLAQHQGRCHLLLGQPTRSEACLLDALAGHDPARRRARACVEAELAITYVDRASADLEAAVAAGTRALDLADRVDSGRVAERVRGLDRSLRPHAGWSRCASGGGVPLRCWPWRPEPFRPDPPGRSPGAYRSNSPSFMPARLAAVPAAPSPGRPGHVVADQHRQLLGGCQGDQRVTRGGGAATPVTDRGATQAQRNPVIVPGAVIDQPGEPAIR
jgi:hypothetical protein